MTLKVLLLNFSKIITIRASGNVTLVHSTIESNPTLHDFHAIVIDTNEILNPLQWSNLGNYGFGSRTYSVSSLLTYNGRVREQIITGGIAFCLSSFKKSQEFFINMNNVACNLDNYFFCPVDLGIVSEKGDTFYPKSEELKYYTPLIKQIPKQDIDWTCYFSKIPDKARIIATNRAGYAVFLEVPIGAGKLVMLPNFKDRSQATAIIVNEIIPKMIHEEDFAFVPQWLNNQSSPLEKELRGTLSEVENAKRLLFTRNQALKKAVAFAFEKIGFKVEILPDGTLPDLRLSDGERSAIVEVKGHENKQSAREDVSQVLSYMSETDIKEKGMVVVNHQLNEEPCKRNAKAFTDGAIQLAEKIDISLISSVELFDVVMKVLEGKLDTLALKKTRDKIMNGSGVAGLP